MKIPAVVAIARAHNVSAAQVLHGGARYEWGHALPAEQRWRATPEGEGELLPRKGRRLSVIFRDAPPEPPGITRGGS